MKWINTIKNKIWASIVLLSLCLLVLLSNYLDKIHSENIKEHVTTLYDDRLIVEEYILKMTKYIYEIREIILINNDGNYDVLEIKNISEKFKHTYTLYSKTKLTEIENVKSTELYRQLMEFENLAFSGIKLNIKDTDLILKSLDSLSEIQLVESKTIMKEVETEYAMIKSLSDLGIAIVCIILFILQILVFSGEKVIPIFKPKNPSLN